MTEKEIRKIKNQIWDIYYNELQNHCCKCPHYHIQLFERFKEARITTHRCKALSTDHRDEYNRGYYQILDLGQICPISKKQITSKTIGEVIKLTNSPIYREVFITKDDKLLKDVEKFVLSK